MRTGQRLHYKLNAFGTFIVAMAASAGWIFYKGPESFTIFYQHWPGLLSAALFNSFAQAVYCYLSSFGEGKLLALGGNSGNVLYDWFIGRELNPRIGSFDIKSFNELRPVSFSGPFLTSAVPANSTFSFTAALPTAWSSFALSTSGTSPTHSSWVGHLLHHGYHHRRFWIHSFVGDLVWVPFVYSLQARYLAFRPSTSALLALLPLSASI